MSEALWVAMSGLPVPLVSEAIPPACRRTVDGPATVQIAGEQALVETPVWPAAGATSFVPSFSVQSPLPFSGRLELSVRVDGAWSAWVAGVGLGPASFAPSPPTDSLDVDIDVFRARIPVEAARLRLRLQAREPAAVLAAPWILALSSSAPPNAAATDATTVAGERAMRLAVPARSQMEAQAAIAPRICSPTCVAMVLDFWRRPAPLDALAAEIFHPGTDLYGVWPAAIMAAGRRGLAGYLLRFPDWAAAQWCLARGLPIIASVRYSAGELTGAAAAETAGHLIVLTGWDGDEVLVNDPAAPSAATVSRRYRRTELTRIWLERSAMGYVLFPVEAREMLTGG
jgi:peptidase C39-like protein